MGDTETSETAGLDSLQGNHIMLTTFRKSGKAMPTPVWYGHVGEHLYIFSLASKGKVKRIRNNPRVQISACTGIGRITGPTMEAQARILPKKEEIVARRALRRKHPVAFRLTELFSNRLLWRKWAFLDITLL